MSVPGDTKLPDPNADQQQLAEARDLVSQSPDASVASAPVSDVEGMKGVLLDDWSRETWYADDIEAHPALRVLRADFPDAIVDAVRFRNETTIHVVPAQWREICVHLRDHPRLQMNMLSDLTAVDMLRLRERPRFDVVAQLYSIPVRTRLRLKTGVDDGEHVPSLVPIWNGADWLERECYDMFGIVFDGHPNLKRMLLPDDWEEGHPLRKDYPLRGWREFPVYNTERTVGRVRTRWTGRGVS